MHSPDAPLKVVHAADVHLDTPFRRHDAELRQKLQELGREAFSALVDLTLEERADALLIAGDLFDNEWLTIATERMLKRELRRLTDAGVTVVYATGNHDPGRTNYRAVNIDWPVTGFHLQSSRTPRRIPIQRGGERVGWVVAVGHQTPNETANLAETFRQAPGPEPAIALLHADVAGVSGESDDEPRGKYAPAARTDLDPSYVYWALGHIHLRQPIPGDFPAWYPGNLYGRDFGETGAKGALVVELDPPNPPLISFRALAKVRWETLALSSLANVRAITDVQAEARVEFARRQEADCNLLPDQEWILRVELSGPCPLVNVLRDESERAELAGYLADSLPALDVEVRDFGLHRPVDLAKHLGQHHMLGVALELINRANTDDELLRRLAPQALARGDDYPDGPDRLAYLRRLLDGLDAAAAERLLRMDFR